MSQSFLFTGIHDGKFLSDDDFSLLLYSGDRKGCDYPFTPAFMSSWIMGNLAWSCTVPPFSIMNNIDKTWWSKWVELMTKDVACTFDTQCCGYLNQVCIFMVYKVDKVCLTCRALHNWLLEIDGLSGEWKSGVPVSDWVGKMGSLDFDGLCPSISNAIARMSPNLEPHNYDLWGVGPGEDIVLG